MKTVVITSKKSEIHVIVRGAEIDPAITILPDISFLPQFLDGLRNQSEFTSRFGDQESIKQFFTWADQVYREREAKEAGKLIPPLSEKPTQKGRFPLGNSELKADTKSESKQKTPVNPALIHSIGSPSTSSPNPLNQ